VIDDERTEGEAPESEGPAPEAEAAAAKPKPRRTRKPREAGEGTAKPRPRSRAKPKPKAERTADDEAEPKRRRRTATPKPEPAEQPEAVEEAKPAEPAAPEPVVRPGRRERAAGNGRVLVRAQAKYTRSSARKARLVCDLIRGKSVEDARAILATTTRAVARDWSKLLESAVANAENNHELDGDELRIHAIRADEGPTLKRYRPRAMGRATRIRKRTSHLTIQLTPKE
jgi:ribosomal protein L22